VDSEPPPKRPPSIDIFSLVFWREHECSDQKFIACVGDEFKNVATRKRVNSLLLCILKKRKKEKRRKCPKVQQQHPLQRGLLSSMKATGPLLDSLLVEVWLVVLPRLSPPHFPGFLFCLFLIVSVAR
jgi:hypothetical protein